MEMVVVANHRGGVSKTETARFLALDLAERGYKVLALDLSSMGYLFDSLKNKVEYEDSAEDKIEHLQWQNKHFKIQNAIYKVRDNLHIAQGSMRFLFDICVEFDKKYPKNISFRKLFKDIEKDYDYCIVDVNSSFDYAYFNFIISSDEIIIPIILDEDSYNTLEVTGYIVDAIKDEKNSFYNPDFKVAGILVTRWIEDCENDLNVLKRINEYAKKLGTKIYDSRIHHSLYVKNAKQKGVFLKEYAPEASVTKEYIGFVDEFIEAHRIKLTDAMKSSEYYRYKRAAFSILIPQNIRNEIERIAMQFDRSLSYTFNTLLEKGIELSEKYNCTKGIEQSDKKWLGGVQLSNKLREKIERVSAKNSCSMSHLINNYLGIALKKLI